MQAVSENRLGRSNDKRKAERRRLAGHARACSGFVITRNYRAIGRLGNGRIGSRLFPSRPCYACMATHLIAERLRMPTREDSDLAKGHALFISSAFTLIELLIVI